MESLARARGEGDDMFVAPRALGESDIPFLRFDLPLSEGKINRENSSYRAEIGFGPAGVQYNHLSDDQLNPATPQTVQELYGLYRMSFFSCIGIDLGVGNMRLNGVTHENRFSWTTPIRLRIPGFLSFEFRPAWAQHFSDYDFAVLYSWPYVSLKAGYRWVDAPYTAINGPYVGMAVHL